MTSRRFSQAISEGDGISIIAEVREPEAAQLAENEGAEGVLVSSGYEERLAGIGEAVSVPVLFYWNGQRADRIHRVAQGGERNGELDSAE